MTSSQATDKQWWWCLDHERAEDDPDVRGARRLGPYASRSAAEHAIERVQERNEAWDNDPRWNDDAERDASAGDGPAGGATGGSTG